MAENAKIICIFQKEYLSLHPLNSNKGLIR